MTDMTQMTDHERALCREAVEAAVREYRATSQTASPREIADRLYPDPTPELPEVEHAGHRYRYNTTLDKYQRHNGVGWCHGVEGAPLYIPLNVTLVRALASLLPKRELTDEIVRKVSTALRDPESFVRHVLLSVWDDIAGPAALAPQWWGVVDKIARLYSFNNDDVGARKNAEDWDQQYPHDAPHRVVALAEVPSR